MHRQRHHSTTTRRGKAAAAALLIAAALAGAQPAAAQVELLGPGAAFVSLGGARVSTQELDGWLGARGYPTFGRSAVSVGLGGYRVVADAVLLGVEAQGFIIGDDTHEQRRMGLGAGYATVAVGYAFDVALRLRFYPRVGLGAGGIALWVETADSVEFADALEQPAPAPTREPNLARDGVVLDVGAGAELLPRDGGGLMFGLRAGWLTGPFTDTWEMYEQRVNGGPDASMSGPYVRLTVGWSWRR